MKSTGCFEISDDNGLPDLATFVCSILQCASVSNIENVIEAYIPGATLNTACFPMTNITSVNSDDILESCDKQLLDILLPSDSIDNNNQSYRRILQNITEELNGLVKSNPEPKVDLDEAKIWIRQAKCDYSALSALMHVSKTDKAHFAAVCFLCHQVGEKSLKAGMYAKYGLNPIYLCTHDLIPLYLLQIS